MTEPPNLRIHDAPPSGGQIQSCGSCKHYGLPGAYDPAKARDEGARKPGCLKHGADVRAIDVCDDYSRGRGS